METTIMGLIGVNLNTKPCFWSLQKVGLIVERAWCLTVACSVEASPTIRTMKLRHPAIWELDFLETLQCFLDRHRGFPKLRVPFEGSQ